MRERSAAGGIFRVIGRILLILLVTILLFAVFLLGVMGVLIHGPSAEAERLFVLSVNETSALKFLPHIYLSDAQVDAILHPVSTSTDDEPSPDDNFVELPYEDGRTVEDENTNAGQVVVADPSENTGESGEWLEVVDIKGSTFKGKLMIIRDPSKVVVGTLDAYGANYHGLYLYEFIDKYNAIGGTNAGGFYDPGGGGNGGIPDGLVMRDGAIAYGNPGTWYLNVIGFDADHILHVGDMSGQQALDLGLMSAVSFSPGPVLVKDGEATTLPKSFFIRTADDPAYREPRTGIGQIGPLHYILIVVDGRRDGYSEGMTLPEFQQLFVKHGVQFAFNLDGGGSTTLYFQGEVVNMPSSGDERRVSDIVMFVDAASLPDEGAGAAE